MLIILHAQETSFVIERNKNNSIHWFKVAAKLLLPFKPSLGWKPERVRLGYKECQGYLLIFGKSLYLI